MTSGELAWFSVGTEISDPISEERNGKRCRASSRTAEYYLKRGESRVTEQSATEVGRGRRQAKAEGKIKEVSE